MPRSWPSLVNFQRPGKFWREMQLAHWPHSGFHQKHSQCKAGATGGPSGMTTEHLRPPMVDSMNDMERILSLVASWQEEKFQSVLNPPFVWAE